MKRERTDINPTAEITSRKKWVDAAKGIAILAVVIDHAMYLYPMYRIENVWKHTSFSVTWFVFLSGYLNVMSLKRDQRDNLKYIFLRSFRKILLLFAYYAGATTLLYILNRNQTFSFWELLHYIQSFSMQPTYYFVFLLLQLYIIFPIIYIALSFANTRGKKILLTIVLCISSWLLSVYTNPSLSHSGLVVELLGGLYLAVFYFGIYTALYPISKGFQYVLLFLYASAEVLFMQVFGKYTSNTPNVFSITWSMLLLFFIMPILKTASRTKNILISIFAFIGKYTLGIYLFHFYILDHLLYLPQLGKYSPYIAPFTSVMLPILIIYASKKIQLYIRNCYHLPKENISLNSI